MASGPTSRLRAICLSLPEAFEQEAWGDPTFRVRGKIFAMEKRGDGRISLWCKAPPGSQMVLVGADPERFFVPAVLEGQQVRQVVQRQHVVRLAAEDVAAGDDGPVVVPTDALERGRHDL